MCRQEVYLGPTRHEPLARIKHVTTMRALSRHHSHPDQRTTMQVDVTGLGCRNREPPLQLNDDRPYYGTLLLQRVHVAEKHIERKRPDVHLSPFLKMSCLRCAVSL